jgi:hypothetical protein
MTFIGSKVVLFATCPTFLLVQDKTRVLGQFCAQSRRKKTKNPKASPRKASARPAGFLGQRTCTALRDWSGQKTPPPAPPHKSGPKTLVFVLIKQKEGGVNAHE